MKRIPSLLTIVSILVISFISCKKDSNADNSNPNPSTSSNYLSRISFYSNDGSGTEVLDGTTTYVFDNQKRVTKKIDSSLVGSSASFVLWQTTEYFYNGNDTLPFKEVIIGNPAAQIEYDTTISYFTYNSAGLLIRDTGFYVSHGTGYFAVNSNQTFTYSGTMITGRMDATITQTSGSYTETRIDTAQTDANGNIIHNIKHKGIENINSTITWDNHPSPFSKLSNFRSSFIFPFGETFFYEMPQYNNRLHITEVQTGGSTHTYDEDLTGNYTYNAEGYPSQILEQDPTTTGAYEKVIFEYRSL
ncbi:MAG: hypothetical protein QM737_13870 [Ferruginibacter sp.]